MKTILVLLIIALVFTGTVTFNESQARSDLEERNHDLQEFEVTIKIVYNSIPLEKAVELEKEIKRQHKGACTVTIEKIEPVSSWSVVGYGFEMDSGYWYYNVDSTTYSRIDTIYNSGLFSN